MKRTLLILSALMVLAAGAVAGTVTGIVTSVDGEPVEDAVVSAAPCDSSGGMGRGRGGRGPQWNPDYTTRTNENGEFTIEDVPEGSVFLRAMQRGEGGARVEIEVPAEGTITQDLQLSGPGEGNGHRRHHFGRWRHGYRGGWGGGGR
ncbi:hypothetical protein GF324_03070 [bacterium]|nr:hypothetical protein [bacterium]